MHDNFKDEFDKAARANSELTARLRQADYKNANLQIEVQRLKTSLALLIDMLDVANGEIARLSMMLRHQAKCMEPARRAANPNPEIFPPAQSH